MHACPCCGYRTLPDRGAYEVCPVCWWLVRYARPKHSARRWEELRSGSIRVAG